MILTRQVKAARALLDWSQEDLAFKSGVSTLTIVQLEMGDGAFGGLTSTRDRIFGALESAGVIFVDENGGGPGVRLKSRREGPCSIPLEMLNASNDQ